MAIERALLAVVALLGLPGFLGFPGLPGAAHAGDTPVPSAPDDGPDASDAPDAPAHAAHAGAAADPCLRVEEFQGPEYCGTCHPRHYLEWRGSAHAYAAVDPIFLACNRKAQEETGGAFGTLCLGCHATVGLRGGVLDANADRAAIDAAPSIVSRGVSCEVCHRMEPPAPGAPIGNASFGLGDGSVFYGRLRNPVASGAHDSRYSLFHGESRLCGSCHDVLHDGEALEKSFVEWSASPYNEQRAIACQDCHMLRYSGQAATGGPFRETLRRHNFPAVTVPLIPFPNRGYQEEEIRKFIRTAVRMVVLAPREVRAGGTLPLTVLVKNSGAGHNVPTGISTMRQMWIEVTVTAAAAAGEVIYRSGDLDGNGDLRDHRSLLDPGGDGDLVSFNDRFYDEEGREVLFMWDAARLEERSLRPFEERRAHYEIPVPERLLGRSLEARVRILFRPFAPFGLRALELPELIAELPIWEMDADTSPPVAVVESVERRTEYHVPRDFATIEDALDALVSGDRLTVAPGEYVLARPLDFRGKGIAVVSEAGRDLTVLRLSPEAEGDALSAVLFTSGEESAARLEGFTVSGGAGTLDGGVRKGGGVYIRASSPTLRDNRIARNRAAGGYGGGICVEGGRPVLAGNEMLHNWAAHGGALAFRDLADGAPAEALHLAYERYEGNVADEGGAVYLERRSRVVAERVVLAGNHAWRRGGALFAAPEVDLTLLFATVVRNVAGDAGGALFAGGERPRARSSIFWENRPFALEDAVIEHSVVDQDLPAGSTNRSGFPLFLDPTGFREHARPTDDVVGPPLTENELATIAGRRWPGKWIGGSYRLLPGSPAIDAGDPSAPPDADDSLPDAGAYFLERPLRAFVRGDADGNGRIDAADLAALAAFLAADDPASRALPCRDAADLDDDGRLGPLDVAALAGHLLIGLPVPAPPWPACGLDPTFGEGLSCQEKGEPCLASER